MLNETVNLKPFIERNSVVLVTENDKPIEEIDKLLAHEKGLLHRAFSIFIFNNEGRMLLQQRSDNKYHGAGLWTNACCSHPQWNEDIGESAIERLYFEMGFTCEIRKVFSFIYNAEVENGLTEHEYDHVFLGYTDQQPNPNPHEVKDFKWISIEELAADVKEHSKNYTYWFKSALPKILSVINIDINPKRSAD